MAEAPSEPTNALLGLIDALDGEGALRERLEAFAARLGALVGAAVAVEVALADRAVVAAGPADLSDGVRVDAGDGATLIVRPAAAAELATTRAAARLLRREVDWLRRAARAARTEDVMSAVTHEMNNALTPLLCHGCEPVVRESLRMRALLETLRIVRGRARPRDLRWAGDLLERSKKLLALSGAGTFPVEVRCSPEASHRAVGPEQDRLLPVLLAAGYALRNAAAAGASLALRADVRDDRLTLELEAPVAAPWALAGELERPDPEASGLDVRACVDEGGRVVVTIALLRRPRVVVLEPTGGGGPLADRVAAVLRRVGLDVARADDPGRAQALAVEPLEPAALIVLPGASAQALRQALHRTQPLLASRLMALDERLAARGYRPAPDEVDLATLLASALEASP